jgi:branched-chain amino acid transport system ATP-binding protein
MSKAAALATKDIVAGYGGVAVLDGLSISVPAATITAVLGANGAGKTTLLRTISGFVRPQRGRILLDEVNVARYRPEDIARAGVAHVPEGQGVITELTIEENLRLGALIRPNQRTGAEETQPSASGAQETQSTASGAEAGKSTAGPANRLRRGASGRPGRESRKDRAAALAGTYERFPLLGDRRHQLAGTLSGGERQILVIARALMAAPRVLLLDEPSLGLAPRMVAQVMDLVRQLRDDSGLTVLLVEQNARSALAIADRGIVLNLGKIAAEADAADLAADVSLRRHYLGF